MNANTVTVIITGIPCEIKRLCPANIFSTCGFKKYTGTQAIRLNTIIFAE